MASSMASCVLAHGWGTGSPGHSKQPPQASHLPPSHTPCPPPAASKAFVPGGSELALRSSGREVKQIPPTHGPNSRGKASGQELARFCPLRGLFNFLSVPVCKEDTLPWSLGRDSIVCSVSRQVPSGSHGLGVGVALGTEL